MKPFACVAVKDVHPRKARAIVPCLRENNDLTEFSLPCSAALLASAASTWKVAVPAPPHHEAGAHPVLPQLPVLLPLTFSPNCL